MNQLSESNVEEVCLDWLAELGWQVVRGSHMAPEAAGAERDDYGQVILERRLRESLVRLNPDLPASALTDALHKLTRLEGPLWRCATAPST